MEKNAAQIERTNDIGNWVRYKERSSKEELKDKCFQLFSKDF